MLPIQIIMNMIHSMDIMIRIMYRLSPSVYSAYITRMHATQLTGSIPGPTGWQREYPHVRQWQVWQLSGGQFQTSAAWRGRGEPAHCWQGSVPGASRGVKHRYTTLARDYGGVHGK